MVGMCVVAAQGGRRGLGRHRYATWNVPLPTLALERSTSTQPAKAGLYERLGFRVLNAEATHIGEYRPVIPAVGWPEVRVLSPGDRLEVLAMNHRVFGADRSPLLAALARFAEQVVVAEGEGGLVAHAAAWRNVDALTVGPVVARDDATCQALVQALSVDARGPVCLQLPSRFAQLSGWIQDRGLLPTAPSPLMSLGGRPIPGDRSQLYALVMQALG